MNVVRLFALSALSLVLTQAHAQTFPEGSAVEPDAALKQRLAGKVFSVKLANGTSWRLEYKDSGYFFINTSTGFADSGQWTVQEGKLCSKGAKIAYNCNEVRTVGEALFLKRDSGEIVQFVVQ